MTPRRAWLQARPENQELSREPGAVAMSPATWDVALSPSREPGAVKMSQAKWSTGIEARPRP